MLYKKFSRFTTPLLLTLSVLITIVSLYYSSRHASFLEQEERAKIDLWVEATTRMASLQYFREDYTLLLQIIEKNDNLPVILTDANLFPISIRNIPQNLVNQPNGVDKLIRSFRRTNPPIVIKLPSGETNYVFYGSSPILNELRYFPYIQLFIIVSLILFAYLVFRNDRIAEQNRVWVGMARETAHQLGTPISSLMAWAQIIQEDNTYPELSESLQLDIDRLQKVTDRFSKIGAPPQLNSQDVRATIESSVSYMRPRIAKRIQLVFTKESVNHPVPHNNTLIAWVVENLIRNSVDAIEGEGIVALSLKFSHKQAIIDCSDSGKGMTRKQKKKVFQPGYSTKTRGWGLGLSLAQRIVKQYHKGRILVVRSELLEGCTIRITLSANTDQILP